MSYKMVERMSKRTEHPEDSTNGDDVKRVNLNFTKEQTKEFFNGKIWSKEFQRELKSNVENSEPYRWGTITELVDDTLLRSVRKEVLSEIAFTKKETDIYKVYQSGDLANLSGLDWDDLSRLPALAKLRAGIYSEGFRDFVSAVTGCGKLSGIKTDMSINTYTRGCHLLTHDDVIGSRRVSFILYLPDPDRVWKPHYGGGLRLFPAVVHNVPHTDFSKKLVPQFNQIAFFTVQPGLSFHDVEEVRVDKQRLSIQGWFHIPQQGEPGFIPGEQEETEARSTLQQLQSKELQEFDFPKSIRSNLESVQIKTYEECSILSETDVQFLAKYLNPTYLLSNHLNQLQETFLENSIVELKDLFNQEYADALKELLKKKELEVKVPSTSKDVVAPWKCAVPPHKQRYMYIDGKPGLNMEESSVRNQNSNSQDEPNFQLVSGDDADNKLIEVASFIRSTAFKKWLKLITDLITTSEQVLVRRFRPGKDFILATTTEKDLARGDELNMLLEATINLTPSATSPKNWESGEYGGYELCMSLDGDDNSDFEEDDDPAVYKSGDSGDSNVLYTSQCTWNSLTLMLRDPSVLKFIKYVSINAKGSRWDISCQWNVKSSGSDEEDNSSMSVHSKYGESIHVK